MSASQNSTNEKQNQLKDELLTKQQPAAKKSRFRRDWVWFGARAYFLRRHNATIWGKKYGYFKFDLNGSTYDDIPLTN